MLQPSPLRRRIFGLENEYGLIFSPNGRVYLPTPTLLHVYNAATWERLNSFPWQGGTSGHFLMTGTVCAFLAVLPALAARGSQLFNPSLALLMGAVPVVGLGASLVAVRAVVKSPLLTISTESVASRRTSIRA